MLESGNSKIIHQLLKGPGETEKTAMGHLPAPPVELNSRKVGRLNLSKVSLVQSRNI
jgi:hypothetical protein